MVSAGARGLDNAMSGELLEFSNGAFGMAQNLESNDVGIIILGDLSTIREGDEENVLVKSWKYQ